MEILIIDYGLGNLGSIINMFRRIGVTVRLSSDVVEIRDAKKVLLPGVGSFDQGMQNLQDLGIDEALKFKASQNDSYIMGICLGMQLLTNGSEEGIKPGLGLIDAHTIHFSNMKLSDDLRIPHMGWDLIDKKQSHPTLVDLPNPSKFYFVHSYFVRCNKPENVLTETTYGEVFHSSIIKKNIMGFQFHPEKSHKYGMQLFKNFASLDTSCL